MSKDAAFDFIPNPQGRPLDDAALLSSALAKEDGKPELFASPAFGFPVIAMIIIALLSWRAIKR